MPEYNNEKAASIASQFREELTDEMYTLVNVLGEEIKALECELNVLPGRLDQKTREDLANYTDKVDANLYAGIACCEVEAETTLPTDAELLFENGARCAPLVQTTVYESRIVARVDHECMRVFDEQGQESVYKLGSLNNKLKGRLFLGVRLGESQKIRLSFSTKLVAKEKLEPVDMSLCSFWNGSEKLSPDFYTYSFRSSRIKPGREALRLYQAEEKIVRAYEKSILTIEWSQRQSKSGLMPEAIGELISSEEYQHLTSGVTHWLEIRLPSHFEGGADEIEVLNNPIPVVNRVKRKIESSNELKDDQELIIPVEEDNGLKLLAIDSVDGNGAKNYNETTFTPFFKAPAGSYRLYRRALGFDIAQDQFNELSYLIDQSIRITHELGANYPHLKSDNRFKQLYSSIIKPLKEAYLTALIQQQGKQHTCYLQVRPRSAGEQIRVWAWMMDRRQQMPLPGTSGKLDKGGLVVFWK